MRGSSRSCGKRRAPLRRPPARGSSRSCGKRRARGGCPPGSTSRHGLPSTAARASSLFWGGARAVGGGQEGLSAGPAYGLGLRVGCCGSEKLTRRVASGRRAARCARRYDPRSMTREGSAVRSRRRDQQARATSHADAAGWSSPAGKGRPRSAPTRRRHKPPWDFASSDNQRLHDRVGPLSGYQEAVNSGGPGPAGQTRRFTSLGAGPSWPVAWRFR